MTASLETISFNDKSIPNVIQKRKGYRIGNWLAVTRRNDEYLVYKLNTGKPLIEVCFIKEQDAVNFAKWIDEIFSDYFVLWEEYPDANIFSLLKWTIPDGIKIFLMTEALKKQHVSMEKAKEIYKGADEKEWIR